MIKNIEIVGGFWTRFKGLMFRKSIKLDEAMLFLNCSRVHTCFMKFDICIIYLDKYFNIIYYEVLKPWRIGSKVKGAKHLVEASKDVLPYLKLKTRIVLKMEEVDDD